MRSKGHAKALIIFLLAAVFALCLAIAAVRLYYPLDYYEPITEYAQEYGLDPALVCAVIHTESKFKKDAVSPKGAAGLMQLTEPTAVWLAGELGINDFDRAMIFEPDVNIRLGCYYLRKLGRQYGDISVALCAYNAGSGNVGKWLKNPEYSLDGNTLRNIPFPETRSYIKRVDNTQAVYEYLLKLRELGKRLKGS